MLRLLFRCLVIVYYDGGGLSICWVGHSYIVKVRRVQLDRYFDHVSIIYYVVQMDNRGYIMVVYVCVVDDNVTCVAAAGRRHYYYRVISSYVILASSSAGRSAFRRSARSMACLLATRIRFADALALTTGAGATAVAIAAAVTVVASIAITAITSRVGVAIARSLLSDGLVSSYAFDVLVVFCCSTLFDFGAAVTLTLLERSGYRKEH